MNKLQKYRYQLTKCCKPIIRQPKVEPKPKTGIEKEMEERDETAEFWRRLESK